MFTWDAQKKAHRRGPSTSLARRRKWRVTANVSADFLALTRAWSCASATGEGLFVLPLCGAAGDQSPHLLFRKQAEATLRQRKGKPHNPARRSGQRIAAAVGRWPGTWPGPTSAPKAPFVHKDPAAWLSPSARSPGRNMKPPRRATRSWKAQGLDALEQRELHRVAHQEEHRPPATKSRDAQPVCETEIHTLRLGNIARGHQSLRALHRLRPAHESPQPRRADVPRPNRL